MNKPEKKHAQDYDVVIVNYNGENIITECLNSLYSSTVRPNKVIIYDNNSRDKSLEIIRKNFPQVILIEGPENLGFGRANNEAMKCCESEFILFMNNDVILDKKCSQSLLEGLEDPNLALLNPIIYKGWDKKTDQGIYAFGAEMNKGGFNYGLYDITPNRNDLNSFSAACVMARGAIIKKLKFEKRFFLYYEEPDISIRIIQENFKIGRIKEAKCYHLENYSTSKNNAGICFRQYYAIQNHWYMLGKYWPSSLLVSAMPLNILHLLYNSLFFLRNKEISKLKILYLSWQNFFQGRKLYKKNQGLVWTKKLPRTPLAKTLNLRKKVYE